MTPREFFDKVVAMRNAQKKYFMARTKSNLEDAKRLEREIDDEINRVNSICTNKPSQPMIF